MPRRSDEFTPPPSDSLDQSTIDKFLEATGLDRLFVVHLVPKPGGKGYEKRPVESWRSIPSCEAEGRVAEISRLRSGLSRWGFGVEIPEGWAVVDVDRLPHPIVDELPPTLTVRTIKGLHYWYRLPEGATVRTNHALDGIDLQATKTYVMVPGSPGYTVESWDVATFDPTPIVHRYPSTGEDGERTGQTVPFDPESIPWLPGDQRFRLMGYAMWLAEHAVGRDDARALVHRAGEEWCSPRYDSPLTFMDDGWYDKVLSDSPIGQLFDQIVPKEHRPEPPTMAIERAGDTYDTAPHPALVWGPQDALIEPGDLGFLYGKSGGGKTFLATGLAVAVHNGTPWLGLETTKGRVLLVAYEGRQNLNRRLHACELKYGADWKGVERLSHPDDLKLVDETSIARFRKLLDDNDYDLVVIDTLSMASGGVDEDKAKEMTPILRALKEIARDTSTAIVLVAHTGKNEAAGIRGSYAQFATADFVIKASKPVGDDLGELFIEKVRDGRSDYSVHYMLEDICLGYKDARGRLKTTKVAVEPDVQAITEAREKEADANGVEHLINVLNAVDGGMGEQALRRKLGAPWRDDSKRYERLINLAGDLIERVPSTGGLRVQLTDNQQGATQ